MHTKMMELPVAEDLNWNTAQDTIRYSEPELFILHNPGKQMNLYSGKKGKVAAFPNNKVTLNSNLVQEIEKWISSMTLLIHDTIIMLMRIRIHVIVKYDPAAYIDMMFHSMILPGWPYHCTIMCLDLLHL